ncbi:PAS domain-containing sensor histidine kinase [Halorarius litoreus]|uniref:PAS domain-containing sensor histidine kinase n=1 Tax=Halorarius litoreus TaxID=2962676 RepID=UPI0020CE58CE|nr:PAS domain S-box protein [Halorarius litoreus]
MSNEESLLGGKEGLRTPTGSGRILLLVQGERNRNLLADLLDDYEVVEAAPDTDEPLPEFDLCIVGEASYRAVADTLVDRKENAGERYLPVLLLVGESGGHETSQRLHGVADDTLQIPATEAVIRSRVESLLRTRHQSLQLAVYRRAMDNATTGITIADADDDQPLTYLNDAFAEITGYDREEALGRNCRFLQGKETEPETVERLHDAIEAGEAVSVELRNYRKDGTEFWNHLEISPVYDNAGELTHYIGFQSDTTARRQGKEQLRKETETLERLFEASPVGITVLDTEGQITRANATAEEVLGLERSDVVGRTFDEPSWEIVGEDGEPLDSEELPFSHVMTTGETVRDYHHGIAEGGETRWLSINAAPLTDESGERTGVITTLEDITERRAQERELERLVNLLDQTQAIAKVGGWEINTETDEVEYTKGLAKLVGTWPRTEFTLDEAFRFYHPDDEADARAAFERLVATGEPQELETRIQTASGETRWAHIRGEPHESDPSIYRGTVRDITERREREQELERYERIVEAASDLIYTLDGDLRVTSFNTAVAQFVGRSTDSINGEHLSTVFGNKHTDALADVLTKPIAEEMTEATVETTLANERGEERTFQTTLSVGVFDQKAGELVCIGRDVTELQERERRLSVFDRVLRHNLRNKMNIIQGWADMLIDDPTKGMASDAAVHIQEASEELLNLSELVRKFNSVTDPSASDRVTLTDVAKRVENVAAEAKLSYSAASITVETPPVAEAWVHESFELALDELVDNAAKHSGKQPSIHLSVTVDDESDAVVVRVADDGPGIPTIEKESVTVGQESPLQHTNGLGLWFVRWMATNSGGSMRIKDGEPTGAVVELRFSR